MTCRNPEELLVEDQEVARKKRRKNKGKDDAQEGEPQSKKMKQEGANEAEPAVSSPKLTKEAEPNVTESTEVNHDAKTSTEAKKKKKKRKNKNALVSTNDSADKLGAATEKVKVSQASKAQEKTKQDKGKKMGVKRTNETASMDFRSEMTDERLKAYGFNPKKVRNQIKYGKTSQS